MKHDWYEPDVDWAQHRCKVCGLEMHTYRGDVSLDQGSCPGKANLETTAMLLRVRKWLHHQLATRPSDWGNLEANELVELLDLFEETSARAHGERSE